MLDDRPGIVLDTVDSARSKLTGHDEDDILLLIEHSFVAFAWNIALSESAAREIRIFPGCVDWYARTLGKEDYPLTEEQAISEILKSNGDKPFIKGKTTRLLLNCSPSHLTNLIEAKLLSTQPGTTYGRGCHGTALITIDSIRGFLKSRRIL